MILFRVLATSAACADDTGKYLYQADRVPVGQVFHYVRTSPDGSAPERTALFVAARDRIEAIQYRPGGTRAARMIAWMDWTSCTVRRLESWRVPSEGEPTLLAIATAGSEGRSVDVTLPAFGGLVQRVEIARRPWHIYDFDLASLNVTMAHLASPRDTITIGLAEAIFAEAGLPLRYRGEATLAFLRDEVRGGEKCRAYSIDGPGLDGKRGTIWSRARDGFFQDMEIALADESDGATLELKLDRIGRMSEKRWEKFMREASR